jgi:hypothetical protein
VAFFCNPASGGTFSSTAIEIIKWVKKIAVAVSLCEISQNASRKKPVVQNNNVSIQVEKFTVQKNSNSIVPTELLQLVLNQQKIDVVNAQRQNPSADMVSKLIDHFVNK